MLMTGVINNYAPLLCDMGLSKITSCVDKIDFQA